MYNNALESNPEFLIITIRFLFGFLNQYERQVITSINFS